MGRRFLDAGVAVLELGTPQDISAANDHRDLATTLLGLVDLLGNPQHLLHADAAFPGVVETFPGELEHDSSIDRCCIVGWLVGHATPP